MAEAPSHASRALRGALAGAVAGLVAAFAMDRFQALAGALSPHQDDAEPATDRAADALARATTGRELSEADKPLGGQAIHYGVGAALGVAYGIAAEFRPAVTAGFGTGFGTATSLLLDDAAVPAAGLGDAPWRTPPATHLYALASHLVFGAVAEAVRRGVGATLQPE